VARPREFDPDDALARSLDLFWARGFAGVSLSDLEEATGVGRQSLYAAFGNKEALYAAALERYNAATERWLAPLFAQDAGLDTLRRYARDALLAQGKHRASGCLVVKTLWDRGLEEGELQASARAAARRVRAAFAHALGRAQERGELAAGDAALRADLCFAAVNGLAALRRSGVSEASALASFELLLDSWRSGRAR
jgi:TetR/AcrR family transcriptional repressor of nem operon